MIARPDGVELDPEDLDLFLSANPSHTGKFWQLWTLDDDLRFHPKT